MRGRERQSARDVLKQPMYRSTRNRLVVLLSVIMVGGMMLLPRLASASDPFSTLSPKSDEARDIQFLYKLIFWIALFVFIGVQAAIVWTVLRYRRRSEDEERPEQIHGNQKLEVIWTIIPAIVLVAIFIPTVRTMFEIDSRTDDTEYTIQVFGKQWWWEVHYTEPESVANIVTANDIYVPVGKRVRIELLSSNVIHSFYVPQLAGKMDLIPGHENVISILAEEPGMYFGECAEFCGESHAYMRFKIIAVPDDQFAAWIGGMTGGPSSAATSLVPDGDLSRVPASMALCLGCHRVGGVPNNASGAPIADPPLGLAAGNSPENQILGPNLAMLACRTSLAAGIIPNDEESLREWLHNPGQVKQGNFMATQIGTTVILTDQQVDEIVAYLKTLHPEGGCPEISGFNADKVHRLADDAAGTDAATPVAAEEAFNGDRRYKS